MKRVFMTGASGFIGRHVARHMSTQGFTVAEGIYDITNFDESAKFVSKIADGDFLLHLAGLSAPGDCEKNPKLAYDVNVQGTQSLCEALLRAQKSPHFLFASSAHVYAPKSGTLTESSPVKPLNTYGRTKRACEVLLEDWSNTYEQRVTIFRLFNHSHMSQPPHFFLSSLYQKLRASKGDTVTVGNLDLERDIGSVQDLVSAFGAFFKHDWKGQNFNIFNLSSGVPKSLKVLAETLRERIDVKSEFKTDPALLRRDDPATIVGDSGAFQKATGWRPTSKNETETINQFLAAI